MTWVRRLSSLIDPLKHVRAFEMFVVLSQQTVKGKGFLDVFLHPSAELGIFLLPSKEPSRQVSAGFLGVAPSARKGHRYVSVPEISANVS
jgi:hypothetical protein